MNCADTMQDTVTTVDLAICNYSGGDLGVFILCRGDDTLHQLSPNLVGQREPKVPLAVSVLHCLHADAFGL